eukprot:scaffold1525_cov142-Cylindrotheca_fusiformis.AAC.66
MMSPQVNISRDILVRGNEMNQGSGKSSNSQSTGSRSRSTTSRSRNSKGSSTGHRSRNSDGYGTDEANNLTSRSSPCHTPANPLPQEKSVRFNEIHIRDYERTVGDNPSCSSGPPIGQGSRKKGNLVLNRTNREALLAYWKVPVNEVVEAIRGNIRVKNQRRQTVTNLGKVEKIEEAFESAARKLKKALLLRRRTEGKAKGYQVYSKVAPTRIGGLKPNDGRVLKAFDNDKDRSERKTGREDMDMPGSGSRYWTISTNDHDGNSPSDIVYENEETSASSLSGFTLGNSTTASMLEMEKFYRELELEMFGDMELPSMVGQTLEVPGVDIPEKERVYYSDAISSAERQMRDNSVIEGFAASNDTDPLKWNGKTCLQQRGGLGIIRQAEEIDIPSSSSVSRQMNHTTRIPQYFHDQNREASYPPVYTDAAYANYRLSRSLESLDLNPPPSIRPLVGYGELYHPPVNQATSMRLHGPVLPNGMHTYQDRRRWNQRDSPEVRHLPLQSHTSPTHFMEDGHDDGPSIRPPLDAVVISEDMLDEDQILLFGGGQPYGGQMYALHHSPNQQFPSPIYHHRYS